MNAGGSRFAWSGASRAAAEHHCDVRPGIVIQNIEGDFTMATATAVSKTFKLGSELEIHRLGYGAMRITGKGIWGEPDDRENAKKVLKRAVELGVDFIDTADSYGPAVSERLIGEALAPDA